MAVAESLSLAHPVCLRSISRINSQGREDLELTRSMKVSEVTQSTERRISCLPTDTILIHTYKGTAMS